jgi:endonuclease YncB( thermonuclease family)
VSFSELEGDVDIYTIIFAALAVVVCLRLYSVLGQHAGSGYVTGILFAVTAAALGVVVFDVGGAKWFPAQATVVSTTAMPTISGPARVIDGDTVVVAGIHVRLKGVDAAELGTARGETARAAMIGIVTSDLTCRLTGEKTYRREVGYCTTANGTDINRAIIASGAALACPRYDDRYVPFEQATALAAQPRSSYCVKHF